MHDNVKFAVVTRIAKASVTTLVATKIVIVFELEAKTGADAADANHASATLQLCFALSQVASHYSKKLPVRMLSDGMPCGFNGRSNQGIRMSL